MKINEIRARYLRHVKAGRVVIASIGGARPRPALQLADTPLRSAAHHISELEGGGLVYRLVAVDNEKIRLTPRGRVELAVYELDNPS